MTTTDRHSAMKFSLYIPIGNVTPGQFQSMAAVREMAAALEAANIDACCVTDHPAPSAQWLHGSGHDALDPFTALGFVAAASSRLQLQTSVLVLPYRNPFITAKAATTLQVLSGGRLVLGVGAGYQKAEFEALGVDFHRRGRLSDEALQTIREVWQGGEISRQGMGFNAQSVEPRPAPSPPPKIWVGGSSEKALARAIRYGDGWCPFFALSTHSEINRNTGIQSIDDLGIGIEVIAEGRARQGLAPDFDVNIAVSSTDTFAGRTRGEAEGFLEQVTRLQAIGVNWVTLKLQHPTRAAYLDNVAWFGEEVVARV